MFGRKERQAIQSEAADQARRLADARREERARADFEARRATARIDRQRKFDEALPRQP